MSAFRVRAARVFNRVVENVSSSNGERVLVDNEGALRQSDNRTNTTIQRTAIGTAIGAIIGAIAGGGKGAAIGATVGAGHGRRQRLRAGS